MTDLESIVRATLVDEAQRAPSGRDLATRVDAGVRADRPGARAALLAVAACVALATVVGGATFLAGRQPTSVQPGGSSARPAVTDTGNGAGATAAVADGPLVTDGECSGLTVRLALPGSSAGRVQTVRPLVPGPDNRWDASGHQVLYLQASGPCVDRLAYDVVEAAGQDRAQGPTGDVGQRFADGLGPLVTHADSPGAVTVRLTLGCADASSCAETSSVLATLTLSVTGSGASSTLQPTSVPDVLTTVTFTQNGTVTSTVTSGSPLVGPETVTETVGP